MKKTLSLLITAVMLLSMLAVSTSAFLPLRTDDLYTLGDVNNDGAINAKDTNLLKSYIVGKVENKDDISIDAADIKADGSINTKDLYYLKASFVNRVDLNDLEGKYPIKNFTIAGNPIEQYTIVIPEDAVGDQDALNTSSYTSAYQFRHYIACATGWVPQIIWADQEIPTEHVIRFYQYDPFDDIAVEMGLGNEGYKWEVVNGDINIYSTLRGALYAMYEISEDYLGMRFIDDEMVFIYRHRSVDIPEGTNSFKVPRLEFRFSGQQFDDNRDERFDIYYANRLNGSQLYYDGDPKVGYLVGPHRINAHSYDYYWRMGTGTMPEDTSQYKNLSQILDAKYQSGEQKKPLEWQPCATDEESYNILFSGMKDYIAMINGFGHYFPLVYGDDSMSFSICDNNNYCTCKKCRTTALKEGYGGLYLALANRAALDIQEYLPGLKIFLILYDKKVPATIRPNEHIILMFCGHGCDNHILNRDAEHGGCPADGKTSLGGSNVKDEKYMKEWADIAHEAGASIWYWSYAVNYTYNIGGGCPNIPNIFYNFDYIINECGFDGIYYEGQEYGFNFEKLKAYLATKFMWDPDMTYEEFCGHMKEYLYMYYGNGYEQLFEYIMMQTAAGDEMPCFATNHDRPGDMMSYVYLAEHYEEMRALLIEAYDLTYYEEQKRRIETLLVSCEFMGLTSVYDDMYTNGTEESRRTYEERYSWMYNYIIDNDVPPTADNIYPLPSECNFDINPMIQFFEFGSYRPDIKP